MSFSTEDRVRVLLAVQESLIGQISDTLDSVVSSCRDRIVKLRFYFREPSELHDCELASEIETLMISHLPDIKISMVFIQSEAISVGRDEEYVFLRARPE